MTHKEQGVKSSSAEFFRAELPQHPSIQVGTQSLVGQRKTRGELAHAFTDLPNGFGIL